MKLESDTESSYGLRNRKNWLVPDVVTVTRLKPPEVVTPPTGDHDGAVRLAEDWSTKPVAGARQETSTWVALIRLMINLGPVPQSIRSKLTSLDPGPL